MRLAVGRRRRTVAKLNIITLLHEINTSAAHHISSLILIIQCFRSVSQTELKELKGSPLLNIHWNYYYYYHLHLIFSSPLLPPTRCVYNDNDDGDILFTVQRHEIYGMEITLSPLSGPNPTTKNCLCIGNELSTEDRWRRSTATHSKSTSQVS